MQGTFEMRKLQKKNTFSYELWNVLYSLLLILS